MTDLSTFNPANVQDLVKELENQGAAITGAWWKSNSAAVEGYLKSIASATLQTQVALAAKRIDADTAATLMQMHTDTLKTTLQFAIFMTEALAQKLVDAITQVIGWVIFNKTGVNLMPSVVKPA